MQQNGHMKIAVAGTGYVGLSVAVLLAQHNTVYAVDIVQEKVELLNRRQSPIHDKGLEEYLAEKELDLTATTDGRAIYGDVDFVVVSTPTDYDPERNYFNTSSVESVIADVREVNPKACIVVKSTVPIGFTRKMRERFGTDQILFSPEFLREGNALNDNLYPSRIIVGADKGNEEAQKNAEVFVGLLRQGALKKEVETIIMNPTEAEAVKLFANTYLAMRVSYFNELDTYAESCGLESRDIIRGVCLDPRIGGRYNNPSFGYGGYCLPKDTKQLLADYDGIPNDLIRAIVAANNTRKQFIAQTAVRKAAEKARKTGRFGCTVGVYRLIMKTGSDNFRQSAIQDIIGMLKKEEVNVVIYEPTLDADSFMDCPVVKEFPIFKERCSLILANRMMPELDEVRDRVYTRDLFFEN